MNLTRQCAFEAQKRRLAKQEAERCLDRAGETTGNARLQHLLKAVQFYLDGGEVGRARAIERVIDREKLAK